MSCFQRSVQPVHYTLASFRRCFIFGICVVSFITGIEKLHAQDTLRVGKDSVQVMKSEYLKDSISSFRQKFTLPAVTSPSITIPRLTPSNYKRQGKPTDPANKELGNVTKGQKELFNSTKFNYSSESGFDPSLKELGTGEKSLVPDFKQNGLDKTNVNFNKGGVQGGGVTKTQEDAQGQWKDARSRLPDNADTKDLKDMLVIRSEKILLNYYDSLINKDIVPPQPPAFFQKEMSKQDMVDQVNKEFRKDTSKETDSLSTQGEAYKKELNGYKDQADAARNTDLSNYKLSQKDAGDLKPLSGYVMDNQTLQTVDSMRNLNLLKEGYSYKEKISDGQEKLAQLKQKQNFWDKSYFEGLMALQQNELTIIQLSPAYGYKVDKRFSVGAGPNLTIYTPVGSKSPQLLTRASARAFVKMEIWKQRMYLQTEDGLQWTTKESGRTTEHTVLSGVGGLLPFAKSLAINMALLYRVYYSGAAVPASSPWVFRIGISTVKSKKAQPK